VTKGDATAGRESFQLSRVDPTTTALIWGSRRLEGLPLFDGGFTDARGVRGRLGPLGSDADIGLAETAPNAAVRRANTARIPRRGSDNGRSVHRPSRLS
jgi:hypothetical protein